MITTRAGFAQAIRDKKPQRALVIFPALPAFFTNEDIAVTGGITYTEILNGDENLTIGRAVMGEVVASLVNSKGLLQSVDFTGQFSVQLGVELSSATYGAVSVSGATLAVLAGADDAIVRFETSPSMTSVYANGTAYAVGGNPHAMIMADDVLYVLGAGGSLLKVFTVNGTTLTAAAIPSLNDFMKDKASKWATENKCVYLANDGTMRESRVVGSQIEYDLWQYVPLGIFIGNKPDKVKTQIVSLSGYDLMQKFDKEAAGYFDTLTYPATLNELFLGLCSYCDVEVGDVSAALNMDKTFDSAPIDNDTTTCREVLAYIAEAAGCYARMSRYGECELVWYQATDFTFDKTDYFSIDEAEYSVPVIDKLQSHTSSDDVGIIVGEGTNGYDIVNNPYLAATTDSETRPWIENLFARLNSFSPYNPILLNAEGFWELQCGDIVSVVTSDGVIRSMPLFSESLSWNGSAKMEVFNTGAQSRGVMTQTNREKIENGRGYLKIQKQVDGLFVEVGKKVEQGGDYYNSGLSITPDGITLEGENAIRAIVSDVERLTIDETGVNAPLIMADEVHAGNLVEMHLSATAEWKGSIQKSLDALPKYLTQDTTLIVPAGAYVENVTIAGFMGAKLTLVLSDDVTINGKVVAKNCNDFSCWARTLGKASIYPQDASGYVFQVLGCQRAHLERLQLSGYRGRTTASNGTAEALSIEDSNARVYNCCIEYSGSTAYVHRGGTFDCAVCTGGCEGSDPTTNANLGYGVKSTLGTHGVLRNSVPMSVNGNIATNATLLNAHIAGVAGGMTYTEPEYVTQTFTISKHCTYLYGEKRIRDDQATTFSQGYYGTYASGNNNWRIGAMWFASAASALAGKTIKSAKLTMRRASGGWSAAVGVYLGTVALAESDFTSTLTPTFNKASTYPIASLARETEATYDVTALMSAIQAGQAIGVFEPRSEFSGNFSPAYTNFYGLGSGYEPVLTVEYK